MAMPKPLTSPNGNNADSLESPIPGESQANDVSSISPGKFNLPPTTIQAGNPQQNAGFENGNTNEDLGDFSQLPQAGQANVGSPGGSTEDLGDFANLANASPEVQGPPQQVSGATGAVAQTVVNSKLVELPDGDYGVQEAGGNIRLLNEHEKRAAHYLASAYRIGGPTIGAILGFAAAKTPGASAGSLAGGELADEPARVFEKMAGEKPHERGTFDRAVDVAAPAVGGAVAKSFVGSGLVKATEEAVPQMINSGAQIATEEAANRVSTADQAGGKLFQHETNAENSRVVQDAKDLKSGVYGQSESDKFKSAELNRGEENINKLDQVFNDIGPASSEQAAKSSGLKGSFEDLVKEVEKRLRTNKEAAQKIAGDEKFSFSEIKAKHPEAAADLPESGTLADFDKAVAKVGEKANFGAVSRSLNERQNGKLYRDLHVQRDTIAANVLEGAGETQKSNQLKADRDFYSSNIEEIRDTQNRLANDPTYVSDVLIEKKNPRFTEWLVQALPKSEKQRVAREFLDRIANGFVDREKKQISASAFDKELNSYDPKILDALLGELRPKLQGLLNYLKIIERYGLDHSGAGKAAASKLADSLSSPANGLTKIALGIVKRILRAGNTPKTETMVGRGAEIKSLKVAKLEFKPSSSSTPKVSTGATIGALAGQTAKQISKPTVKAEKGRSPDSVKNPEVESFAKTGKYIQPDEVPDTEASDEQETNTKPVGYRFKSPKFKESFKKIVPGLRQRADFLNNFVAKKYQKALLVTSVDEPVAGRRSATHREHRGLDFSAKGFSPRQIKEITAVMHKEFGKNSILYHKANASKAAYHFHLEVARNQVGKTAKGKVVSRLQAEE